MYDAYEKQSARLSGSLPHSIWQHLCSTSWNYLTTP